MKRNDIKLIFILSLPRSGSTLLQRVLSTHKDIATHAEPWILLPLAYVNNDKGSITDYNQQQSSLAINDFISHLPNKSQDYYDAVADLVRALYSKTAKHGESFFLDKTPRYYHIIDEINKMFPDAKFIFLSRNPLAVLSSIVKTWCGGKWSISRFKSDLYIGSELLSKGYRKYKDRSIHVKFEDITTSSASELKRIFKYLGISISSGDIDKIINGFSSTKFQGASGDRNIKKYSTIAKDSSKDWVRTFNTRFRKAYAKRYLSCIDRTYLKTFGYDKSSLVDSLDEPSRILSLDRLTLCLSYMMNTYRDIKKTSSLYSRKVRK